MKNLYLLYCIYNGVKTVDAVCKSKKSAVEYIKTWGPHTKTKDGYYVCKDKKTQSVYQIEKVTFQPKSKIAFV